MLLFYLGGAAVEERHSRRLKFIIPILLQHRSRRAAVEERLFEAWSIAAPHLLRHPIAFFSLIYCSLSTAAVIYIAAMAAVDEPQYTRERKSLPSTAGQLVYCCIAAIYIAAAVGKMRLPKLAGVGRV